VTTTELRGNVLNGEKSLSLHKLFANASATKTLVTSILKSRCAARPNRRNRKRLELIAFGRRSWMGSSQRYADHTNNSDLDQERWQVGYNGFSARLKDMQVKDFESYLNEDRRMRIYGFVGDSNAIVQAFIGLW